MDHQIRVINNFIENLQCIQTVPTSGGKTLITATLSSLVEPYGRSIVIVPTKDLATQTLESYQLLGLDVGVFTGDVKNWGKKHTICTWQSLESLNRRTKDGITEDDKDIITFTKDVVAVMVDEAHSAKADVLHGLMTKIFHKAPIRWGLTGTIPKIELEAVSLVSSIGEIIKGISATELQELGVLSKCNIDIIQTQDDGNFKKYHDEVSYLIGNKERLDIISSLISEVSNSGNTLVLVNRVSTGEELCNLIPGSVFIDGKVKSINRKKEYDSVSTLDNKVIIATFGVAAVGINIPRIFNLVLIEPGKSFVRTIQSIGR